MSDGKGRWVKGGIIGAIVGFVAGLLVAPKSGKETRQDIKEKATQAKDSTEKQLKALHKELVKHAREAKAEAAKLQGKAKKEMESLAKLADKLQEDVKQLISDVREGLASDKDVEKAVKEGQDVSQKINEARK